MCRKLQIAMLVEDSSIILDRPLWVGNDQLPFCSYVRMSSDLPEMAYNHVSVIQQVRMMVIENVPSS